LVSLKLDLLSEGALAKKEERRVGGVFSRKGKLVIEKRLEEDLS